MYKLVIIRHGQSVWNLENKFTGWKNVELTEKGQEEARAAGKTLMEQGYVFDLAYTSKLIRAINTLKLCLSEMNLTNIPIHSNWRLNERHYGSLQGLNKIETVKKYGEEQVSIWRRSYDIPPPKKILKNNEASSKDNQKFSPLSESLKNVLERLIPLWENEISNKIKLKKKVLIVAHGNSLRALIKQLGNISKKNIVKHNIPTGIPFVIELNKKLITKNSYYLGDEKAIQDKINSVANQISTT